PVTRYRPGSASEPCASSASAMRRSRGTKGTGLLVSGRGLAEQGRRVRARYDVVQAVALHGREAGIDDLAHDLPLRGRAVGRPGLRDHVLLHHRAAEVVATEEEGRLGHLVAHGRP